MAGKDGRKVSIAKAPSMASPARMKVRTKVFKVKVPNLDSA